MSIDINTNLISKIRTQIEYYLSKENLAIDYYLISKLSKEGFVPISLLAQFKKLSVLTNNIYDIISSIKTSNKLELDENSENVRSTEWSLITWKFLHVLGIHRTELDTILSQIDNLDSFLINNDFRDQLNLSTNWIIRCNNETIAEKVLLRLKENPNVSANYYSDSPKKQLHPSAKSLRPTAKPFTPTFILNQPLNRNFVPLASNPPYFKRNSSHRQREGKKSFNGTQNVQNAQNGQNTLNGQAPPQNESQQPNGKSQKKERISNKSNRRKSVSTKEKELSTQKEEENGKRKGGNKDRSNNIQPTQNGNKSSKSQRSQFSKKNEKSKKSPAPSLNINNYPTLQSKSIKTETEAVQQEVASVQISPGEFSFAEIASKAKDIAPPKHLRVQVTTAGTQSINSTNSVLTNSHDALKEIEKSVKQGFKSFEKLEKNEPIKKGKSSKVNKNSPNSTPEENGKPNKITKHTEKEPKESKDTKDTKETKETIKTTPVSETKPLTEQQEPTNSVNSYADIASFAASS